MVMPPWSVMEHAGVSYGSITVVTEWRTHPLVAPPLDWGSDCEMLIAHSW